MAQTEGFWCPSGIDALHAFLRRGISKDEPSLEFGHAYVRNLGYNLQYLEYLNHTLEETRLHQTVITMTSKSFVITGVSIIESILWFVLKKAREQRTEEWEIVQNLKTSTFDEQGVKYRITNTLLRRRIALVDIEMPLDAMIKRVESKKLLGLDTQVYKDLAYLRKLRNRVHIHAVQHEKDTDWWSFSSKEVKLMKRVLESVLRSKIFDPTVEHEHMLTYLKVSEPTEELADEF
jgi:hypothetical protein